MNFSTTDPAGRLTRYGYYADGKLRTLTDPNSNLITRVGPAGTSTYTYDPLDRVVGESGPVKSQSFTYDGSGNRLTDAGGGYSYQSASNRLTNTPAGTVTLDAAGNVDRAPGTRYRYTYDAVGRLGLVKDMNKAAINYAYDYQHRRTRRSPTGSKYGPAGVYHYDGSGHLIAETAPTGAPLRSYVWRDDVVVAQIEHQPSQTVLYLETDYLGTVRAARSGTGQVVWRWESDAFGATLPSEDPDGNRKTTTVNLRFPGQIADSPTPAVYNWHRYYDPTSGRYVSSDPIGVAGGINTYAYVGGNPGSFIDPLGLARIGSRPLDLRWLPGNGRGLLRHDQIWYDDNKSPDNSGFFDDDLIRADRGHTRDEFDFSRDPKIYDDSLMREAEKNIRRNWNTDWRLRSNDCQDYGDAARHEYDRLLQQRQRFGAGR